MLITTGGILVAIAYLTLAVAYLILAAHAVGII